MESVIQVQTLTLHLEKGMTPSVLLQLLINCRADGVL